MSEASIITIVFFSFSIGVFFGALWMFYAMYKTNKKLEDELDAKNKHIEKIEIDGLQEYYSNI